jgi:hypothetical protein
MPKKFVAILIAVVVFGLGTFICVRFYEYIFSKTIHGQIVKVERVNQAETVIASGKPIPAEQLFSFAVAIKDTQGEIHTASSEDRQWAVAQPGQCAEAQYFPYPPWDLSKAGTFHNARLLRLHECDMGQPPAAPAPSH